MTDSRIRLYQAITDIDDDIIEEAQGITSSVMHRWSPTKKRGQPREVTMRKTLASHMDSPRFGKKRGNLNGKNKTGRA